MELSEYTKYDAVGLAELVRKREVTAAELADVAREAYDRVNPAINAVVEFYDDADAVPGPDSGTFAGVPFLRKDLGPTEAGRRLEGGSRLYKGFRPTVESYFIARSRASGLRVLGRTTVPEFGMTAQSESFAHGITRNPWKLDRTAGGSSSGSAAAVAAGIVSIASGSDGFGSIRVPAANCGLVGLNPSRGRISGGPNHQDPSLGKTRDFVLCRTVRDMAAALDALCGPAPGDPFVIRLPDRPYQEELHRPTGKLRVGVATSAWADMDVDTETSAYLMDTATWFEEMGHVVEEIPRPFDQIEYRKVLAGSAAMALATLDSDAEALGRSINDETLEPLNLELYRIGKRLSAVDALEVMELHRKIRADVGTAIDDFDIVLTPTMPCTAVSHDAYSIAREDLSVDQYVDGEQALCQFLGVFSITGQPSITLPLYQAVGGLPIGMQIVGRFGDEATLVRVARDLEEAYPWLGRQPAVFAGNGN